MKKLNIRKIICGSLVGVSVLAVNPIGVSAKVSQNSALESILKSGDIYNVQSELRSDLKFIDEVSRDSLSNYLTGKQLYDLTLGGENLYHFHGYATDYYVGVNSGQIYSYNGGTGYGEFNWIKDNKSIKCWYWSRTSTGSGWDYSGWKQLQGWVSSKNKWFYYKDGGMQTGWIKDGGNWYYCYSTGEMASDTTISGYKLDANGAWVS